MRSTAHSPYLTNFCIFAKLQCSSLYYKPLRGSVLMSKFIDARNVVLGVVASLIKYDPFSPGRTWRPVLLVFFVLLANPVPLHF
ncbi:hypothetical protein BpHYR1_006262 [Brachionus plicatilis]|uniref:Uncharacterized protein n=1 Tax=Brachionus plicatilis TaxID=10195 RepID=A0A3M7PGQ5_BRAPC|nr:hypothetical protein BpHYR1_006262 [Brachionus plicatilis]